MSVLAVRRRRSRSRSPLSSTRPRLRSRSRSRSLSPQPRTSSTLAPSLHTVPELYAGDAWGSTDTVDAGCRYAQFQYGPQFTSQQAMDTDDDDQGVVPRNGHVSSRVDGQPATSRSRRHTHSWAMTALMFASMGLPHEGIDLVRNAYGIQDFDVLADLIAPFVGHHNIQPDPQNDRYIQPADQELVIGAFMQLIPFQQWSLWVVQNHTGNIANTVRAYIAGVRVPQVLQHHGELEDVPMSGVYPVGGDPDDDGDGSSSGQDSDGQEDEDAAMPPAPEVYVDMDGRRYNIMNDPPYLGDGLPLPDLAPAANPGVVDVDRSETKLHRSTVRSNLRSRYQGLQSDCIGWCDVSVEPHQQVPCPHGPHSIA